MARTKRTDRGAHTVPASSVSGTTRLVEVDDAAALADLLTVNRAFLAPWEPVREETFYTAAGQADLLRAALERHAQGALVPHVILVDGRIAGRITLNEIMRGPFQSCRLGYWVGSADNGRGVATAAVRQIVRVAFGELGLHRIEAGTLLHNTGSQRVLERNGFERFGIAANYLNIAGTWQDHALYQLINPDPVTELDRMVATSALPSGVAGVPRSPRDLDRSPG